MDINYINDKLIEIKELLTKIQNEISSNGKDQEKLQELWGKAYAMLCEYIDLIQIVNKLDFTKMNSRLAEIQNEFESLSNSKEEIENDNEISEIVEEEPIEENIIETPVIEEAPVVEESAIEENVTETPVVEEAPVEENVTETPIIEETPVDITMPKEKVVETPTDSTVVSPIVEEGINEPEIKVVNKSASQLSNKRISVSTHQGTNLYNSASEQSKIIDELYNNKEETPKEETDKEAMWAEVQQLYSEGKTTEAEEISNKIMSLNKPNYQTAA